MPANVFRLRVGYVKRDRLRYLGHLEVLSTIDRCVRRARLPYVLTQGFSPRMKITFTSALPVGCASRGEYYDLFLSEYVPADEALSRLVPATPPDLAPFAAGYVRWEEPALEAYLVRSRWGLRVEGAPADAAGLNAAIAELAATGELRFMRGKKQKRVNLGETLVAWDVRDREGGLELEVETHTGTGASLRPEMLLRTALGAGAEGAVVHVERLGQWGQSEGGALLPALPEVACGGSTT